MVLAHTAGQKVIQRGIQTSAVGAGKAESMKSNAGFLCQLPDACSINPFAAGDPFPTTTTTLAPGHHWDC